MIEIHYMCANHVFIGGTELSVDTHDQFLLIGGLDRTRST